MLKGSYTQLTIKFPTGKERYRHAVECIDERDRSLYKSQADYITAAILSFEGKRVDERSTLEQICEQVAAIREKVDVIYDGQTKGR